MPTLHAFVAILFVFLLGSETWQLSVQRPAGLHCGQTSIYTGARRRGRRVVGGNVSVAGKWPWIATLIVNNSHYCAGSIVAKKWIVTTSHCFHDNQSSINPKDWLVKVGKFNQKQKEQYEHHHKIKRIIRHPNYLSLWDKYDIDVPDDYDVALLELQKPILYTRYVTPICLPTRSQPRFPAGHVCTVAGWGHTQYNGHVQDKLHEVDVKLVSHKKCNSPKSYNGSVHQRAICAGYEIGGRDACQFDSGGPLSCMSAGQWYLVGQVSWGDGCAKPHKYGVYANMIRLSTWVRKIMAGN